MRTHFSISVAVFVLASWRTLAAGAEVESWATPGLPVTEGLVAWYDAAAQAPALRPFGIPLASGAALPQWLDSSGYQRHLRQPDSTAQPRFLVHEKLSAVRFGGRGAHLLLADQDLSFESQTIFLVAAPHRNEGNFRGLLSMHADGQFDYLSGVTVDLGYAPTPSFDALNVEGAGFVGARNLRTQQSPLLELRRLCITSTPGTDGVRLYVDGTPEGARDRDASTVRMNRLILGGRYYGGVEEVRSPFVGDLAEVLIYDRVLSAAERDAVEKYLAARYRDVGPLPPPPDGPGGRVIKPVAEPPEVQMLVPGFTVRELPVKLPNVNNVLYREDGVLVALAYDGNVHLLTDSDGDGLEDQSRLFWENGGDLRAPIGMALTPPGYKLGRGVFVAAKSKCVLLLDADGDDRAEQQIIVADGWTELPHGVDALGVAVDPRDQSVLVGLGVQNFANPFLMEPDGTSKFRLDTERGTILRVTPDFKSRQVVATGIRFPVAIRFNAAGDLFCTDQEGATWLPNGNPFDELLHVEQGRHYGFPPRHPRHLPNVIDEPSVYDYRPQHQSTCGLNFNEPVKSRPLAPRAENQAAAQQEKTHLAERDGYTIFGPAWWRSDAIVTGFSRGKLYRTALALTDAGYVAQNQIIASLTMMPSDACIAPGKSLVVTVHSGGPDWGTGPAGEGKLYKIAYDDVGDAIPSLIWAHSPHEVRIAFDRPVDPEMLKGLAARTVIEGGEFVSAGDRFESFRPGYAAVEQQLYAPTAKIEVQGMQLLADRRTLIISTSAHATAMDYAVAMLDVPRIDVRKVRGPATGGLNPDDRNLPQQPDVDLQYDLCGVEVDWQPGDDQPASAPWQGWLPHLDLDVSRDFTAGSASHHQLWESLGSAGTLRLGAIVDLRDMLHPAVQPGSTLDYEPPAEEVTLTFRANCPLEVSLDSKAANVAANEGVYTASVTGTKDSRTLEVVLHILNTSDDPTLAVSFHTNEDDRPRAMQARRFLLPWASRDEQPAPAVDNRDLPELAGGNWLRGQQEFYGSQAACSKCHAVRGVGGKIGPDLSNLPQRDYASVLRDVTQPSFAINPDFTTQNVQMADGQTLAGTVRVDGDQLIVSDSEGKETVVPRDEVDEMQPSPLSIMPEGIPKLLGEARMKDLLTFLLVAPPRMPVYGELAPPPPRTMAEVEAVLAGGDPLLRSPKKLNIVLVAGTKDHGPGEHDYPAWKSQWQRLLEMDESLTVSVADAWPSAEQFAAADAVVFYQKGEWTPERARDLDAFLARGGGASYIHYAVDGGADADGFAERIGLAWQGGRAKFRHGALDLDFAAGRDHPVARNFDHIHFHDESYWQLSGDSRRISLLAAGVEDGGPQPLFWTREHGGGRVFVSILGHFSWTFDDPLFRLLLLRGIAWSAGESVDRFNELVLPGARIVPATGTPATTTNANQ